MIKTLTGPNSFCLNQELNCLVTEFVKKNDDMGLEKLDCEEAEYARIAEALQSLPFLSAKKMVVLRTPSSNKTFVEKAEKLLADLPENTDVIIIEPKLDKRSSYFKFLQKKTEFKEFNQPDENSLARWLVEQAKRKTGAINPADAHYLVERLGANQQLLDSELQKLLDYAPQITRESIDLLTEPTPQSTIFELLDAAFAGNSKRALHIYAQQRQLQVEPQQIIALIAWQVHVLALIKTAGSRTVEEIIKTTKLNPYVVRKSQGTAAKFGLEGIKNLVQSLAELDVRLKTESIDADEALQNLLVQISQN